MSDASEAYDKAVEEAKKKARSIVNVTPPPCFPVYGTNQAKLEGLLKAALDAFNEAVEAAYAAAADAVLEAVRALVGDEAYEKLLEILEPIADAIEEIEKKFEEMLETVKAEVGAEVAGALRETFRTVNNVKSLNIAVGATTAVGKAAKRALRNSFCLVGGTLIPTRRGLIAIERVQVGDEVLGYNPDSDDWEYSAVTETSIRTFRGSLVSIRAGGVLLRCTAGHRLCVVRSSLGRDSDPAGAVEDGAWWIPAGDVQEGMQILSEREGGIRVDETESLTSLAVVYNLTVASHFHNFAATTEGLLVHNGAKKNCKRASSKTLRKRWEEKHGKEWPKDPKTGRNQDVSHKKPLGDGGTNDVDNIEPLPHDEHVKKHRDAGDYKRWGRRR